MKQPFLHSPLYESVFILGPAFLVSLLVVLFPALVGFISREETFFWLIIVVFIDVAHVYATLFRTYFDRTYFLQRRFLFLLVPLIALVFSLVIYLCFGYQVFWRCMAYMAVFHFVRQQYGFFVLYSRKETNALRKKIGIVAIYSATLYPILHWHLNPEKAFNWFVEDDFFKFPSYILDAVFFGLYVMILVTYVIFEFFSIMENRFFNLPKNAILAGTYLSWYLGIVYYNDDVLFTLLNVVAHGIPYIFFVFLFGMKNFRETGTGWQSYLYNWKGIFVFMAALLVLAYTEEGLWDSLIWHEHASVFPAFEHMTAYLDQTWVAIVTSILTLPQLSHYILDGFIWKVKRNDFSNFL